MFGMLLAARPLPPHDAWRLFVALDAASLPLLSAVAFLVRLLFAHFPPTDRWQSSSLVAGLFMLTYFVHRAGGDHGEFAALAVSLVRALLVFEPARFAVLGLATVERYVVMHGLPVLRRAYERWVEFRNERRRRREERSRPPSTPLPTPVERPPSKVDRMQRQAREARAEFDAEAALLNSLPLDDDEREVLLLQAKQQLVAKLAQLRNA